MTAFLAAPAQVKTAAIDPSPIGIVDEVRNDAFGILPTAARNDPECRLLFSLMSASKLPLAP